MNRIAIIGSGKIGSALATRFHAAGISAVVANSRGAGAGDWAGRIVVDATNAIDFPDFTPRDLNGKLSTEAVSELVPGARVVKAFNTLQAPVLATDPSRGAGRRVLFLSGNEKTANQTISDLINDLGFFPIDLGPLSVGAQMQQFNGPLAKMNLLKD